MADDSTQDEQGTQALSQGVSDEDFNTDGSMPSAGQDSLAINRARAAYGKKSSNTGLRERRTPQRVITSDYEHDEPYEADDIDDEIVIAPEKGIINRTYKSSLDLKEQKTYTNIAESNGGSDVLALQSADSKAGQTISFKVKGIQWKAGYAAEFTKTPLGHTMHPIPLPGPLEERPDALKKTGIVIRPVNPKLQKVLNQLLPSSFKKEMGKEKGKRDRLKQLSIFYLPSAQSASVGFIHEFVIPRSDGRDGFYLYIQTSVGKAPVAIIDEVLRTLEAGLPEGEKADIFDYTIQEEQDVTLPEPDYKLAEEVSEAMKQVSTTLNDSIVVHSVKKGAANAQASVVDFMKQFDKYLARFVRVLAAVVLLFMNSLPMRIMIHGIRLVTRSMVRVIWGVNKVLLVTARSPVTIKIMETIGKGFSLVGGVIGAILNGMIFFFSVIGRGVGSAYSATSGMFGGGGSGGGFSLGIGIPGVKKDLFGGGTEAGKKSPPKIKGDKKAAAAKALPKPQNKSTVSVQSQSKFKQVTKPAPPKIKGATPLPKIGSGAGGAGGGLGGGDSAGKAGNGPLGYFEDEPF
ncbi:hypothetical protein EON78_01975 [bacterium]|nr:MAG: hypothetical protein EON78_01975 [bacterium]